MAIRRLQTVQIISRAAEFRDFSYLLGSLRSLSNGVLYDSKCWRFYSCLDNGHHSFPWNHNVSNQSISSCFYGSSKARPVAFREWKAVCSTMPADFSVILSGARSMTTQTEAPLKKQAPRRNQKRADFTLAMSSPGIIYEPYAPREPIPLWRRLFTRNGWKRTKQDFIQELKSMYAINKLRKTGYTKQKFYGEALNLYKEINIQISNGDKGSLRKAVTEKMYSALKNEIKQRQSMWSKVYWELAGPKVDIRTLRARLIGVDRNNLDKVFVQLTLEFLSKQKFEAYDSRGAVVAGDKNKEMLVRDIWVFEKSLFQIRSYWRLCGRINL